jgi:hypothetical protein
MFKTSCKTILIALFAVVLFGCGGESDEAKKLGFASVDEMKEAHAKGWHTKQKYEEDKLVIEQRIAEEKRAAERAKNPNIGWADFAFDTKEGGRTYVLKYPKGDKNKGSEPDCRNRGRSLICWFKNHNDIDFKLTQKFLDQDSSLQKFVESMVRGAQSNGEVPKGTPITTSEITNNGLKLIETSSQAPIAFGGKGRGPEFVLTRRYFEDQGVVIYLEAKYEAAKSTEEIKADVGKFLNSISLAQSGVKAHEMRSNEMPNPKEQCFAACRDLRRAEDCILKYRNSNLCQEMINSCTRKCAGV